MLTTAEIEKRIDGIMSVMTIREKIGQLHNVIFSGEFTDELKEQINRGEVGMLMLCNTAHAGDGNNVAVDLDVINEIKAYARKNAPHGIPIITARDVIHGFRTVYPIPLAMASAFFPEKVTECYRATANEAKSHGIELAYAPMLDVSRDPRWGRCIEGPGEDPYVGEVMARAVTLGFQTENPSYKGAVAACAKHFVGYGLSEGGRDYHRTEISEYTLRNVYLRAFRAAATQGIASVMSAFNDISGVPATANKHTMRDILKDEFGFEGFVISDWGAVNQICRQGIAENEKTATMLAKNASLDMDMADDTFMKHLPALIDEGKVDMKVIDDSVRRVLRVKYAFGLFDRDTIEPMESDMEYHRRIAREMAREGMVLLKNNGILPLSKTAGGYVHVMGNLAFEREALNGGWNIDGDNVNCNTLAEAVCAAAGNNTVITPKSALADDMVQASYGMIENTVIIALGESHAVTGEAHSRAKIELTDDQIDLVKRIKACGNRTVGVIFAGRPLALEEVEPYLDAIIYAWHSGSECANAVADIIFGDFNPCGKLAMTLPRATGQIPVYYGVTHSGRHCDCYYNDASFRSYDDMRADPLYPFGYGLSYTDFEISEPTVNTDSLTYDEIESGKSFHVSVTVKNTGGMAGKDVIQCYINDRVASVMRPIKELCGFEKPMIEAGENVTVSFSVGYDALSFWNSDNRRTVECGEFDIYVGDSCYTDNKVTVKVV